MPDQIVKTGSVHDYSIGVAKKFTLYVIDRNDMEIPTGKLRGSLPFNILINGVRWECIKTGDVKGRTYDKIKNTVTGEVKTYERPVLIEFLQKNWRAWLKKTSEKVVNSDNSCTFEQSDGTEQAEMIFPEVEF